jgi:class 3 adenylate cyclase
VFVLLKIPFCFKDLYFKQLVDKVVEHGGDIQKFAGDAFFAEWRESNTTSIPQCTMAAAACAAAMVKECADFPVLALGEASCGTDNSPVATLNVHCGLGVGEMIGIHVGDSAHRREYLYVGNPIKQATDACSRASLGEVVVSDEFYEILANLHPHWISEQRSNIIANRNLSNVTAPSSPTKAIRNAKSRGITEHVDGLQVDALIEYRRLMSLYVHPGKVFRIAA